MKKNVVHGVHPTCFLIAGMARSYRPGRARRSERAVPAMAGGARSLAITFIPGPPSVRDCVPTLKRWNDQAVGLPLNLAPIFDKMTALC